MTTGKFPITKAHMSHPREALMTTVMVTTTAIVARNSVATAVVAPLGSLPASFANGAGELGRDGRNTREWIAH